MAARNVLGVGNVLSLGNGDAYMVLKQSRAVAELPYGSTPDSGMMSLPRKQSKRHHMCLARVSNTTTTCTTKVSNTTTPAVATASSTTTRASQRRPTTPHLLQQQTQSNVQLYRKGPGIDPIQRHPHLGHTCDMTHALTARTMQSTAQSIRTTPEAHAHTRTHTHAITRTRTQLHGTRTRAHLQQRLLAGRVSAQGLAARGTTRRLVLDETVHEGATRPQQQHAWHCAANERR